MKASDRLREIADMAAMRGTTIRMPSGTSLALFARAGQREAEQAEARAKQMAGALRALCGGAGELCRAGEDYHDTPLDHFQQIGRAALAQWEGGAQ